MNSDNRKHTTKELIRTICSAEAELRAKQITGETDPLASLRGMEKVKRAIVVAAAGQHGVFFVGPAQSGKSHLVAAAAKLGLRAFESRSCSCGNRLHPTQQCRCFQSEIHRFWNVKRNVDPLLHVDMLVWVIPPASFREMETSPVVTTLKSIQDQLKSIGPRPVFDASDQGVQSILFYMADELGLPPGVVIAVKKISESVAALGNSPVIQSEHVIEALSYRPSLDRIMK